SAATATSVFGRRRARLSVQRRQRSGSTFTRSLLQPCSALFHPARQVIDMVGIGDRHGPEQVIGLLRNR
ncbi:MAG: hypothetical protein ACJ8AT_35630, partial [Hyalangium sp.]|uniref:hypothetical protein n=1 Tax=Hyalangium sp. TaxID=2028555 RepID=UPI00389A0434